MERIMETEAEVSGSVKPPVDAVTKVSIKRRDPPPLGSLSIFHNEREQREE